MRGLVLFVMTLAAGCARSEQVRVGPAVSAIDEVSPATATGNPPIGGVQLPADRTIAADLPAVPTLGVLNRAINAAALTETLGRPGPFTVFAPTDAAFGRLAPGTVEALLKPENRSALVKLLTLHLVPGRLSSAELLRRIATGGGNAVLTSVAGEPLMLSLTGNVVTLTDSGGNRSYVETADVRQANGVIHVVNGVLVPRLGP